MSAQPQAQRVHILDDPPRDKPPEERPPPPKFDPSKVEMPPSIYEQADDFDQWRVPTVSRRFIRALIEELGKPREFYGDARQVGEAIRTDDVDFGILLALPDESLLFAGEDPTARDAPPQFGFIIEPGAPFPVPEEAQSALDLLKPHAVQQARDRAGHLPARQGEWWLLPTESRPVGTVHRPGVQRRPFGVSPLGNHVPTQWGFAVPDDVFMERFHERVGRNLAGIVDPEGAIDWLVKQRFFDSSPDVFIPPHVPDWEDLWEMAGSIYVKGTLRHRENDHYVEKIGDEWREAVTHDFDVYTADGLDVDTTVRLD